MYKKQGKAFVEKYVKLLSYGGGKSPKDMLAELGIDPSDEKFWETGFAIIREEIEELKRLTR
jgi:oligoendopeptidase F